ncbi:DNA-binding response regulator [Lactobacillus sp. CBA3605]|uniref:response regulator transcription factor n=1 Tax=Lactobacillus sp. CBA3605 TaxID=2099788 RepID=UPI000CFB1DDA|nr:response regulator transcription factor [Lactobacillus sp. CBA3605]AVK61839.1 DNA-binding response regulator [Lactobacillus sp. CBA3605]
MFPVYLLEDNQSQRTQYTDFIKKAIMINEYAMTLMLSTDDPKKLLAASQHTKTGLFFLDMEIKEDTTAGLKISEKIRAQLPLANIVFITTHEELSFVTLERRVAPLDYILKDQFLEAIQKKIVMDIDNVQAQQAKTMFQKKIVFNYKIGNRFFSIPMNQVVLVQINQATNGQLTVLATGEKKEASFPGSLGVLEAAYPNLFRCNKSLLINPDYIENYDAKKRVLQLYGELTCKVSFRKGRELAKWFKTVS